MGSGVILRLKKRVAVRLLIAIAYCVAIFATQTSVAAPYAALVMDARSGEVLHARNADTRLHPASLTKMMTLYVAFEAIKNGEITADTLVKISANAAAEPRSKIYLRKGQRIKLRYLIRAAAVKSANDAATAIGEAISGSEKAFAKRMTRTARALGMTRTTFKNAHGLTASGHMSTARDMTVLGRHLFYDFPGYYHLFSRRSADAGIKNVNNTNRSFLNKYRGADGIKTGFTNAAGYNLVASAERGPQRVITTVFGGRSTASRNARVAELMDLGFRRAPLRVAVRKPARPNYSNPQKSGAGKTIRIVTAVKKSPLPVPRPTPAIDIDDVQLAAVTVGIQQALQGTSKKSETQPAKAAPETPPKQPVQLAALASQPASMPAKRPKEILLIAAPPRQSKTEETTRVVSRISTSGGKHFSINIGVLNTRYAAEKLLLKTALKEMELLDGGLRKVSKRSNGWHANFQGLSKEQAQATCRRLNARQATCSVLSPS